MKKFLFLIVLVFVVTPLLSLPVSVSFAASDTGNTGESGDTGNTGNNKLKNPIGSDTIQELVAAILDIVVAIGVPIVIFFLVFTGFKFVVAQGNATAIEDAKKMLFWTIIGGLILLGAKVLSEIILNTINDIIQ